MEDQECTNESGSNHNQMCFALRYAKPLHKISSKSIHNFFSNPADNSKGRSQSANLRQRYVIFFRRVRQVAALYSADVCLSGNRK